MGSLVDRPGISIIKARSLKLNDLGKILSIDGLNSQIAELAVTDNKEPLTLGFFTMRPGAEFEFPYDVVEFKVVTRGKMVLRDTAGNKYIAEVGDIALFSPPVTVIFDAESDCDAVYSAHQSADAEFAPFP